MYVQVLVCIVCTSTDYVSYCMYVCMYVCMCVHTYKGTTSKYNRDRHLAPGFLFLATNKATAGKRTEYDGFSQPLLLVSFFASSKAESLGFSRSTSETNSSPRLPQPCLRVTNESSLASYICIHICQLHMYMPAPMSSIHGSTSQMDPTRTRQGPDKNPTRASVGKHIPSLCKYTNLKHY